MAPPSKGLMPALLYSVPVTLQQATVNPHLHWRLLDTHRQVWVRVLWGHFFLLGPGAHKVLFVPSKSLFPQSCIRTFHSKMGTIKDRKDTDLTEAEDIKKRRQEYTEELYKKYLHDPGVITYLEPDILECEVKWTLGSISSVRFSSVTQSCPTL